jgi:hypothetical protein
MNDPEREYSAEDLNRDLTEEIQSRRLETTKSGNRQVIKTDYGHMALDLRELALVHRYFPGWQSYQHNEILPDDLRPLYVIRATGNELSRILALKPRNIRVKRAPSDPAPITVNRESVSPETRQCRERLQDDILECFGTTDMSQIYDQLFEDADAMLEHTCEKFGIPLEHLNGLSDFEKELLFGFALVIVHGIPT